MLFTSCSINICFYPRSNLTLVVQVQGEWVKLQENTARNILGRDQTHPEVLNLDDEERRLKEDGTELVEENPRAEDIFGKELDIICICTEDILVEISKQ